MTDYRGRRSFARLPGERTLWSGRPGGGILFTRWDILLIPFSLLWCGFAIFWELSVVLMGGPGFLALWGIPFVLVGLYFVFGRFVADIYLRGATRYELTDKRLIIERAGWFPKTTTLFLPDLQPMELHERASGRGTIVLAPSDDLTVTWFRGMDMWSPSLSRTAQLLNIERAGDVFALIQRQIDAHWEKQS